MERRPGTASVTYLADLERACAQARRVGLTADPRLSEWAKAALNAAADRHVARVREQTAFGMREDCDRV